MPISARSRRGMIFHRHWRTRYASLVYAVLLGSTSAIPASASPLAEEPQAVAAQIVQAFDALFSGPHAGARAVHAKGVLLEGEFHAAPTAPGLSRAVHLQGADIPVLVRFSNFAGIPSIAD